MVKFKYSYKDIQYTEGVLRHETMYINKLENNPYWIQKEIQIYKQIKREDRNTENVKYIKTVFS